MNGIAPHIPVMLDEVLTALSPRDGGIYVDGTFGAGGYSRAILAAADCQVIAIDRDPAAIAAGQALPEVTEGRLKLVHGRFGEMRQLIPEAGADQVDGVALDFGVSSMQFDQAERGFSLQQDGPLDMRMESAGRSAANLVAEMEEGDLANLIYQYGDERHSRRIARAIVQERKREPIRTTGRLSGIVSSAVGRRGQHDKIHPATRTFQALRIAVNDELGEIERGLAGAEALLRPAGRLAAVAFHSLEDRIVKTFLRARSGQRAGTHRHQPDLRDDRAPATFELVDRRALKPTNAECARNARARSARLRWAIRTVAPAARAA